MPEYFQKTTDALRASEERLQLALQAGGAGTWDWDMTRGVAEVSPSYRELFGLAPNAPVTYEAWLSHVHPEDRERCEAYGKAFFAGPGTDWRLRFRIVRGDGEVRWHSAIGKVYRDAAGTPLRFVGVSTDITEEQRAIAALAESEERFRAMADGLPLIVWVHDAEGAQQFVNRTFLEYFGVEEAEMKGGRWQLLMHPDDGQAYADEFAACVRERRPFHAEVRVRNAHGDWRNLESWGRPRWSAAGEFLGFVGTSADVTARRRMEQALRDADRRKDEFLAMLGHELRNPLAVISLALDGFKLGLPADAVARTRDAASRQIEILVRLVDDLLDSARISTGKIALERTRLSLAAIVRSALETSRLDLQRKRHQLVVEEAGGNLEVEGDEVRLVQVVSNLLNNAARYTPEGGRIVVSLAREQSEAVLRVRDNGIGIDPRHLDAVFDLFVQGHDEARARGAGLGLGLSLVKKLVELHGGSVAACSEGSGHGAEFIVRLPLAGAKCAEPAAQKLAPASSGARRVLVVDDNRDAASSLAMLVGALGHDAREVYSGTAALEAVASFRPDLIVLDVGLPDMDGYETARRIRKLPAGRDARIVAASGYREIPDAARDAGMDDYLVKPVKLSVLQQLLSETRPRA